MSYILYPEPCVNVHKILFLATKYKQPSLFPFLSTSGLIFHLDSACTGGKQGMSHAGQVGVGFDSMRAVWIHGACWALLVGLLLTTFVERRIIHEKLTLSSRLRSSGCDEEDSRWDGNIRLNILQLGMNEWVRYFELEAEELRRWDENVQITFFKSG
jgi:hypothetical protein